MEDSIIQHRSVLPDDDLISLSEIVSIIIDGKWMISGITGFFAICSLLYIWFAEPVYRADALVHIEQQNDRSLAASTAIEVLQSYNLLGAIVESEGLNIKVTPNYFPGIGSAIARSHEAKGEDTVNTPLLGLSGFAWGGEQIEIEQFETYLQDVDYTLVAEENSYYRLMLNDKNILRGRVGELAVSEDKKVSLLVKKLQATPETLFTVSRLSPGNSFEPLAERFSVSSRGSNTNVLALSLSGANQPENTKVLQAIIDRFTEQNEERYIRETQDRLELAKSQLDRLEPSMPVEASSVQQEGNTESGLVYELDTDTLSIEVRQLYSDIYVAQQSRIFSLEASLLSDNNIKILNPATAADDPIKPKKALIVVLATLLGGMLGTGLVFVREMMAKGVKNANEIEQRTMIPVMVSLIESPLKEKNNSSSESHLYRGLAETPQMAEGLNLLQTSLSHSLKRAENNLIMITSPTEGGGASFLSMNLANSMALTNKRVLLIDADLRKGSINEMLDHKENGLSEVVAGKAVFAEAVQSFKDGFDVLGSGQHTNDSFELLMSSKFEKLLNDVSAMYDIVIIDTPPALVIADAVLIGEKCDTNLMVVRSNKTTIDEIKETDKRFGQNGVKFRGCILNAVPKSAACSGYSHFSYS